MSDKKSEFGPAVDQLAIESDQAREVILHYTPTFIGEGTSHIVYALPNHPEYVVKVHKMSVRMIQAGLERRGITAPNAEVIASVKAKMQKDEAVRQQLADYFPAQHLLRERLCLLQVPLPTVKAADGTRGVEERLVWSLARLQRRLPEATGERLSLDIGAYPERKGEKDLSLETYWGVTDALVQGQPATVDQMVTLHPGLKPFVDTLLRQPAIAAEATDFVRRTISFAKGTGKIFDLRGKDNVVFQQEDMTVWNYYLVDVFLDNHTHLEFALQALEKTRQDERLTDQECNQLLIAVNFVRMLNGLASLLGVDERFPVLSSLAKLSEAQKASLSERMRSFAFPPK